MRYLIMLSAVSVLSAACNDGGSGNAAEANPCDLPVECPDEPGVRRYVNPTTGDVRCQRHDEARDLWLASFPSVVYGNPEDAAEATGWSDNATLEISCVDRRILWRAVGTGDPDSLCLEFCDPDPEWADVCESVAKSYPPCE